ncbi:MAG: hypothetical protein ACM3QU_04745 [Verrucomicrobiota bacterium]
MEPELCALSMVVGNDETCSRAWCAFWEKGGAVVEPGCAISRLGIDFSDPELARYLLDLRHELENARDAEAAEAARKRMSSLVPPDISGA